jgi:hypothetical protein
MVTKRIKPLKLAGMTILSTPWVFDPLGIQRPERWRPDDKRGGLNQLSPTVIDPNAYTPEFKGFLVNIEKV